jgi:hypothetical protein
MGMNPRINEEKFEPRGLPSIGDEIEATIRGDQGNADGFFVPLYQTCAIGVLG